MELSKTDMLQLLSHLETELQARDHVIATLKVYSYVFVYWNTYTVLLKNLQIPQMELWNSSSVSMT